MNARNEGSFRDPFATVFEVNNRVFRGIKKEKILLHQKFLLSKFYKANAGSKIISTNECSAEELLEAGLAQAIVDSYDLWVEHERLDFISYPYEWGFEFLKSAGIFHLDLQLEALKHNYQLQDSSAYNIQFVGSKPIFIDTPSFIEYKDGDHWLGYKQFCEHFLAPLALNYYSNVEFNTLLRGSIDGISIMDASRILPFRSFLNLTIACNIHLHAWAISKISSKSRFTNKSKPASHVPKQNLIALLESLKRCLVKMTPGTSSYWGEYDSSSNSYSKKMTHDKKLIVENFVNSHSLRSILDVGCNSGFFSEVALQSGANRVIGLDKDGNAINEAIRRSYSLNNKFTPILYDFVNPSPSLGWNLNERLSLDDRLPAMDGVICLALIHHLVIGKNIPIEAFVQWITCYAPIGLIEFVPKEDPMVTELLAYREDIFPQYTLKYFIDFLASKVDITKISAIENSHRTLVSFQKKNSR